MDKDIFLPADILIPSSAEMEKWSVIACDQFTSDRDYWERVDKNVGDCPSTLSNRYPLLSYTVNARPAPAYGKVW